MNPEVGKAMEEKDWKESVKLNRREEMEKDSMTRKKKTPSVCLFKLVYDIFCVTPIPLLSLWLVMQYSVELMSFYLYISFTGL